ncbi:MAG TPA: 50S ribosomal protein L11 methyltransferase [Verrucomicrobiota bacterium]|nr:50S ribosomal protein L11 methyltransferase [Verrucomicrobiota bacterium]
MTADLIEISIVTSNEAEEAVAALLERVSGLTPVLYTAQDRPATKVTVYLDRKHRWTDARKNAVLRGLALLRAEGLDVGPGRLRLRRLRAESWVNAWKRHFRPIEIGQALLLKPSWSRRTPKAAQAVVTLDPGLSFGTGQHPTTRFCLEQIVACRNLAHPPSLLDAGTGSGILAIAAAKLGYRPILAFDFDPASIKAARANARANNVAARARFLRGDLRCPPIEPGARFDVVCANLTTDLLMVEAKRIARWMRPEGRLVLAGILAVEFRDVFKAYERLGLKLVTTRVEREWQCGAFARTRQRKPL